MHFTGHGILLDIEGTTSSIRFVYDVMFPYARHELETYLRDQWGSEALEQTCDLIAKDAGHASWNDWSAGVDSDERAQQLVRDEVLRLMDGDVKATGLKQLQGLIWRAGFEHGAMRAHVYDDVPPALSAWNEAGRDLRIYSSGSIAAQQLFFKHTIAGDLLHLFSGHYDTSSGPKKAAESYRKIAADWQLDPTEILFLSDVPAELDAARQAGLTTALCVRPENAPVDDDQPHPTLQSFSDVKACG